MCDNNYDELFTVFNEMVTSPVFWVCRTDNQRLLDFSSHCSAFMPDQIKNKRWCFFVSCWAVSRQTIGGVVVLTIFFNLEETVMMTRWLQQQGLIRQFPQPADKRLNWHHLPTNQPPQANPRNTLLLNQRCQQDGGHGVALTMLMTTKKKR